MAQALEALSAPSAPRRHAAERWLATHLDRGDFPDVASAVAMAGPEVQQRLAAALATDPRHLGLAILCATDYDDALRGVGERAIRALVRDWLGSVDPLRFDVFLERLDGGDVLGLTSSLRCSLQIGSAPLAVLIGRLDRALSDHVEQTAGVVIGVAIDPSLLANELHSKARGRIAGTWAQVFAVVVGELFGGRDGQPALAIEGFGAITPGTSWLWIHARRDRRETADTLLLDWLRGFEETSRRSERNALARALAGTGWPAALSYLEDRWLEDRDPAAYVGLLYAAARGRVAACLTTREGFTALLEDCDTRARGDEGARASAEALLRVLTRIGPVGALGDDLAAACTADWDTTDALGRWLRLAVLESMGRLPSRLAPELVAWIEGDKEVPSFLVWQALRTLAARVDGAATAFTAESRSAAVAAADELLAAGLATEPTVESALEWLERAELHPAAAWREHPDLGRSEPVERLAAAVWWIVAGEAEPAGRVLAALVEQADTARDELLIVERLSRVARTGRSAVVERAFEGGIAAGLNALEPDNARAVALRRLGLLTVGLEPKAAEALLEHELATRRAEQLSSADFMVLGALALHPPVEERARASLFERAAAWADSHPSDGLADPWVPGIERAFQEALARGDDRAYEDLLRRVRTLLGERGHPLATALESGLFPTPPGRPPRPLEALDRTLPAQAFQTR